MTSSCWIRAGVTEAIGRDAEGLSASPQGILHAHCIWPILGGCCFTNKTSRVNGVNGLSGCLHILHHPSPAGSHENCSKAIEKRSTKSPRIDNKYDRLVTRDATFDGAGFQE